MPTYGYNPNPAPLSQEELDALAAQQTAMGGAVPQGGYQAAPAPLPAPTASPVSETAMANPQGTTYGPPPQPSYIPESSAYQPTPTPYRGAAEFYSPAQGAPPQHAYSPESSAYQPAPSLAANSQAFSPPQSSPSSTLYPEQAYAYESARNQGKFDPPPRLPSAPSSALGGVQTNQQQTQKPSLATFFNDAADHARGMKLPPPKPRKITQEQRKQMARMGLAYTPEGLVPVPGTGGLIGMGGGQTQPSLATPLPPPPTSTPSPSYNWNAAEPSLADRTLLMPETAPTMGPSPGDAAMMVNAFDPVGSVLPESINNPDTTANREAVGNFLGGVANTMWNTFRPYTNTEIASGRRQDRQIARAPETFNKALGAASDAGINQKNLANLALMGTEGGRRGGQGVLGLSLLGTEGVGAQEASPPALWTPTSTMRPAPTGGNWSPTSFMQPAATTEGSAYSPDPALDLPLPSPTPFSPALSEQRAGTMAALEAAGLVKDGRWTTKGLTDGQQVDPNLGVVLLDANGRWTADAAAVGFVPWEAVGRSEPVWANEGQAAPVGGPVDPNAVMPVTTEALPPVDAGGSGGGSTWVDYGSSGGGRPWVNYGRGGGGSWRGGGGSGGFSSGRGSFGGGLDFGSLSDDSGWEDLLRDFDNDGDTDEKDENRARKMAMKRNGMKRTRRGKRGGKSTRVPQPGLGGVPTFPESEIRTNTLAAIDKSKSKGKK